MTILYIKEFVLKPEKESEFMKLVGEYQKYQKENPDKFKEMKAFGVYRRYMSGGTPWGYAVDWIFESSEEYSVFIAKYFKEDDWSNFDRQLVDLIEPATYKENVFITVE